MTYRYGLRRLRQVIGGEGHRQAKTPRRFDRVNPLRRETAEPEARSDRPGECFFTVEARRGDEFMGDAGLLSLAAGGRVGPGHRGDLAGGASRRGLFYAPTQRRSGGVRWRRP